MERIKSILIGKDYEALNILIPLHCSVAGPKILDVTYNTGKMWKGTTYFPVKMDINPEFSPDIVGSFFSLPFAENSFDVIVFDPPHLPTSAASTNSSRIYEKMYGITDDKNQGRDGNNVSDIFLPFLLQAKRVLKKNGILLAKIADLIHSHKYQWQQVDFINAVRGTEMTPCDLLIKADPNAGNLSSSKWQNVKHLRKAHCYWIVVRNSSRCERI